MTATAPRVGEGSPRLGRWQAITVGYLVLGYSGYYFCRSNLSVSIPYIIDELKARGMDEAAAKSSLGLIASIGTLAYAAGKVPGGMLADAFGGRRNFLVGMAGAVAFTALFASGGSLGLFGVAWFGNRLVQSMGWPGMVKVAGRWFTPARYGTVMGIVSLSYLFGEAASKAIMGRLFDLGLGWRSVFLVAAGTLGAIFLAGLWLLKESPASIGERIATDDGHADPATPSTEAGDRPPALRLLASPTFCLVCLLSLALTLVRETFNTWTPEYYVAVGLTKSRAAWLSSLFPLAGGVSVLLAGFLADSLGRGGRMVVMGVGLAMAGATMAGLAWGRAGGSTLVPIGLVTATGFFLIGPYSYLAGAVALDYGGRTGGASASGLIDGVGYLGGVFAGVGMARVSIRLGWGGAFGMLAVVAWGSSLLAAVILLAERRWPRGAPR